LRNDRDGDLIDRGVRGLPDADRGGGHDLDGRLENRPRLLLVFLQRKHDKLRILGPAHLTIAVEIDHGRHPGRTRQAGHEVEFWRSDGVRVLLEPRGEPSAVETPPLDRLNAQTAQGRLAWVARPEGPAPEHDNTEYYDPSQEVSHVSQQFQ